MVDYRQLSEQDRAALQQSEGLRQQHGVRDTTQTRGGTIGAITVDRFPLLSVMSAFLRVVGWVVLFIGIVLFFLQVLPWVSCMAGATKPVTQGGRQVAVACASAILTLAPMIGSFTLGCILIAFGEIIGVFRGIEGNTHQLLAKFDHAGYQNRLMGEGQQT